MIKLCVFLLAASVGVARAEEGNLVPDEAQLAGVWVGVGMRGVPFYRLQLSFSGTGFLAETDMRRAVSLWEIKHWALKGTNLTFKVSPVAQLVHQTNSVSISGRWQNYWMSEVITLEVKSPGRTGGDQVVLRKENDLRGFAMDAKRATDEVQTNSVSKP